MVINDERKYCWKCAILLTNPYSHTAWKVSKYGEYGQEKTPYLDTFHAVSLNTNAATRGVYEKRCF